MDLQLGRAATLTVVPAERMTSPTATVYDRDGTTVDTPTATPSTVATTVAEDADNSRTSLLLDDATGIVPGLTVAIADAAWGTAHSVVSAVDGDTVRLVEPLPAVPTTGATVVGLDIAVALAAFSELYRGYVLEVADASVETTARLVFNVVKYPYIGPCAAIHVRDLVSKAWPGERAILQDATLQTRIAGQVNSQIRGQLLKSATFLSGYWDPDSLATVRSAMLRLVLAESYGLREPQTDRENYLRSLRFEVRDRIGDVLKSAELYDGDGDGVISERESGGRFVIDLAR